MGIIQTWAEWIVGYQNSARNFDQDVGNVAVTKLCGLYNKYGGLVPQFAFQRSRAMALCQVNDTPIITGDFPAPYAQCAGDKYRMVYRQYRSTSGTLPATLELSDTESKWFVTLTAPIVSVTALRNGVVFDTGFVDFPDPTFRTNTNLVRVVHNDGATTSDFNLGFNFGIKVFRFDPSTPGVDDTCNEANPVIDEADLTENITINNYNQEGDVIDSYDMPITFNVVNNSLSFPINIDFGGLDIELNDDGYGTPEPEIEPTAPDPSPDSPDLVNSPPPGIEEDEEIEEVEVEDETIEWVLVTITKFPPIGKTITMKSAVNNTYFAGYFSWTIKDGQEYRLEEYPIRKQRMAFKAPENISGYAVYSVNGATLSVRQYTQTIEAT